MSQIKKPKLLAVNAIPDFSFGPSDGTKRIYDTPQVFSAPLDERFWSWGSYTNRKNVEPVPARVGGVVRLQELSTLYEVYTSLGRPLEDLSFSEEQILEFALAWQRNPSINPTGRPIFFLFPCSAWLSSLRYLVTAIGFYGETKRLSASLFTYPEENYWNSTGLYAGPHFMIPKVGPFSAPSLELAHE